MLANSAALESRLAVPPRVVVADGSLVAANETYDVVASGTGDE